MKSCADCKLHFPLTEFYSYSNGSPRPHCKPCHKLRSQRYAKEHRAQRRATYKKWYDNHPEERSAAWARKYSVHRTQILSWHAARYERDPAAVLKRNKTYRTTERGRLVNRMVSKRRRARKANAECVHISLTELQALHVRFDGMCAWCPSHGTTLDHVVPLARGGMHAIGNLVPCCSSCNSKKNARDPQDWAALAGVDLELVLRRAAGAV